MESTKTEKNGESERLKAYLRYIEKRITYLKILNSGEASEYKYYCALRGAIKEWGKSHILFYGCLYGKISVAQAKNICGVSERTFYRIMNPQRKALIEFIEEQERILSEKYPFIPVTDIFDEEQ